MNYKQYNLEELYGMFDKEQNPEGLNKSMFDKEQTRNII